MSKIKLKDYNTCDTIAAISTFPSKAALGVIKISGPKAISAASKIFLPKSKKKLNQAKTFTIHYGWIFEKPKKGKRKIVDEVLVSLMRQPNSYTTEDVVEISTHGGPVVLNKILDLLISKGLRQALPGEFTYRALVNGRIDLLQAQGILGIVDAKTQDGLTLATSQLKGEVSDKMKNLKDKAKNIFTETEAYINFPEDAVGISYAGIKKKIYRLDQDVCELLLASREGKAMKEGLKCVICGRTNAGKSTLFNRLLREERVIVSKSSGTTRDVVEETINIKGVSLRIYDTAGIFEPKDLVAKQALEKTSDIFQQADLVILVCDGSKALNKDDVFLLEKAKEKNAIILINKSDLKQKIDLQKLSSYKKKIIKISALKGQDLKKLEKGVYDNVYQGDIKRENAIFLSHYQEEILKKIKKTLGEIRGFLKDKQKIDFINFSLKVILDDLGKIKGEIMGEEILESIFSNFCIGK